jgi:signal transduction histidine kinase
MQKTNMKNLLSELLWIITLSLFFTPAVLGQEAATFNSEPNSINFTKAITIDQASDSQMDSIFALIQAYGVTNGDSSLLLGQKAMELTKNNPDKYNYANALVLTSNAYGTTGDQEKSEQLSKEAKILVEAIGDDRLIGEVNNNLGNVAYDKGDYEAALDYYILAAKSWERLGNKLAVASAYHNIGAVFFNMNDLPKVQEYSKRSWAIAEELDNDELRVKVISSEAIDLMTYGIHYYLKNEADTINLKRHTDTLNLYFEKSDAKYIQALKIGRGHVVKDDLISLLNNYVALNLNMGKLDKALALALEADVQAEGLGEISLLIQSKSNLGDLYTDLEKYDVAAKYGEESLALAKENGLERKVFIANRVLYELYKKIGKHDKANIMLEEMMSYEKRVGDVERTRAISEVDAQYQTVKKEKQILELAATNAKIKTQRNTILGSMLTLGLFGFFGFRFYKIIKERNDKKTFAEALLFGQETERKRIARDLHDGIGQSLLLIKKQLNSTYETTTENNRLINDTLEEVRTISRDLHPFQLEKFGLTTAINDVIERVEKSTDLFITKEIEKIDDLFSNKEQIHFYRVIQEALNNIVKHAQATAAKISIEIIDNDIVTKIMDNGKGYDHEIAIVTTKSLGLRTMYERISSLNGRLKIEKNKPSGTITNFTIPKKR